MSLAVQVSDVKVLPRVLKVLRKLELVLGYDVCELVEDEESCGPERDTVRMQ